MRRYAIGLFVFAALVCGARRLGEPGIRAAAAVSLGDSYISGEAGRWAGNSITPAGDKDGTDRACLPAGLACQVDKTRVYEKGTEDAGCHRSDVSEIHSAALPVAERVDLSCSGAVTKNIFRAAGGGQGQNGEPPQADKLLPVARGKDVKVIMLSIGGNDLGFAGIISACLQAYAGQDRSVRAQPAAEDRRQGAPGHDRRGQGDRRGPGRDGAGRLRAHRLPPDPPDLPVGGPAGVGDALPGDRARSGPPTAVPSTTRTPRGRATGPRRRSAPSPRPPAGPRASRRSTCSTPSRATSSAPGRRAQNTPFSRPLAARAEWGRFLGASTVQQGELQEAFHPNAYGQRAIGACVTRAVAAAPGAFSCSGAAGLDPSALALARQATFARPRITGCLAARSPVGRRSIGRFSLGVTRRRLLASPRLASISARSRTGRRYRYCVKKSKGLVTAVFGKGTKVELLLATPAKYGNRGVRPGTTLRTAKRRFRGLTRVKGTGVYRLGPRSLRLVGVRKARVRYVGVASKRVLGSRRLLRAYVRRASR